MCRHGVHAILLLQLALLLFQAAHLSVAVLLPSRDVAGSSSNGDAKPDSAAGRPHHSGKPLKNSLWIVEMNHAPAVSYTGGIPGLEATAVDHPSTAAAAAAAGGDGIGSSGSEATAQSRRRFSATSQAAVQYASFISAQADSIVATLLRPSYSAKIQHRYNTVFAGFTVGPLSASEVRTLRQDSNVKSVTRDSRGWVKTIWTPAFLGLSSPNGAWAQLPGGGSKAGDGIVIGMIDTGYWPEGPSFSDRQFPNNQSGKVVYGPPPASFKGACREGEEFASTTCNNKVIGCNYFHSGVGQTADDVKAVFPYEQISCRSMEPNTHGAHTASTAAGNHGVLSNNPRYQGSMSGMAPGARLAIYKAAWGSDDGGFASDFVAAIEQATRDGVDVINYSLGAAAELTHMTPVETAFRHAAAAGVFVAAACGNTGPGPYSIVDTWGPWIMSVGASTYSRTYVDHPAAADGEASTQEASAPQVAFFSSRGPIVAGDGNLLKPDITAPGLDVVAQTDPRQTGYNAQAYSGTSMSSPHIAGIAALIMQKHPSWSPMAVKSAMPTTAYQQTKTGPAGLVFGGPFDFGSGHVDPTAALDPGLVFDSNAGDWTRFLCGSAQIPAIQWGSECPECTRNQTLCDPSNLNMPSIAVSEVAGSKTAYRMLTNVKGSAEFTAKVVAPNGFSVEVQPQVFTSKLGDTTLVRIHITRLPNTPYNVWGDGSIIWTSSLGTTTRIPIVLKAARLASKPAEVHLKTWVPKYHYYIEPEWTGSMITKSTAFKASKVYKGTVSSLYEEVTVTLPPGVWSYVRFALFNDDLPSWQNALPAGNDLDLLVYKGNQLIIIII